LTASSATSWAHRVAYDFSRPIGPPSSLDCCAYDIWFIWNVMVSSHDWHASVREIILASFWRITGWEMSGFPNTMRWCDHFKHSSTMVRIHRITEHAMAHRSWLKLLMITMKPLCSFPRRWFTGTLTLSNWMNVVAAAVEYEVLMRLVSTLS